MEEKSLLEKLNDLADKHFPTDNAFDYINLINYNLDSAIQICPMEADAFQLSPPIAGLIKDDVSFDPPTIKNPLIARQLWGYSGIARVVLDERKFIQFITRNLEEVVKSMAKLRNDLKDPLNRPQVHIRMRGGNKKMFIEREDCAAFEYRVFVDKVKEENE